MDTTISDVFVFIGPSLPIRDARELLDASFLPPVAQGDVLRVARRRPRAIGIVDGFFERVPAVWHKEILWAMEQGIPVFGAASMGALRAAELYEFGMVGVGRIFEAFRDGILEDDDEVALIHGPPDSGYRAISEPMVNVRRNLSDAADVGVIGQAAKETLLGVAKSLHYPERNYPRIVRLAAVEGIPATEASEFLSWVEMHGVDQKREDAEEMLQVMKSALSRDDVPHRVSYKMERTEYWMQLQRQAGTVVSRGDASFCALRSDAVLEELRLHPEQQDEIVRETVTRNLIVSESQRHLWPTRDELVTERLMQFRRETGTEDEASYLNWLKLNDTTNREFSALIKERATEEEFYSALARAMEYDCIDTLRLRNEYFRWIQRYEQKRTYLEDRGLSNPSFDQVCLTEREVIEWFFRKQDLLVPSDIRSYAISRGYRNEDTFFQSVLMEFIYKDRL